MNLLLLLLQWRWLLLVMDLLLRIQRHLTVLRAHSSLAAKTVKQNFETFRHVCKASDCLLFCPMITDENENVLQISSR